MDETHYPSPSQEECAEDVTRDSDYICEDIMDVEGVQRNEYPESDESDSMDDSDYNDQYHPSHAHPTKSKKTCCRNGTNTTKLAPAPSKNKSMLHHHSFLCI